MTAPPPLAPLTPLHELVCSRCKAVLSVDLPSIDTPLRAVELHRCKLRYPAKA